MSENGIKRKIIWFTVLVLSILCMEALCIKNRVLDYQILTNLVYDFIRLGSICVGIPFASTCIWFYLNRNSYRIIGIISIVICSYILITKANIDSPIYLILSIIYYFILFAGIMYFIDIKNGRLIELLQALSGADNVSSDDDPDDDIIEYDDEADLSQEESDNDFIDGEKDQKPLFAESASPKCPRPDPQPDNIQNSEKDKQLKEFYEELMRITKSLIETADDCEQKTETDDPDADNAKTGTAQIKNGNSNQIYLLIGTEKYSILISRNDTADSSYALLDSGKSILEYMLSNSYLQED